MPDKSTKHHEQILEDKNGTKGYFSNGWPIEDVNQTLQEASSTNRTTSARKPTKYDILTTIQKNLFSNLLNLNAKVRKRNSVLKSANFDDQAPRSWITGSQSSRDLANNWQDELKCNMKTRNDEYETKHGGPSLFRAIRRTYGRACLLILVCMCLTDLVFMPAFYHLCIRLIELIGQHKVQTVNTIEGEHIESNATLLKLVPQTDFTEQLYGHTIMFLVAIISYQLLTHPYAWLCHKTGLRLRVALSEMIYKKALRIDASSSTDNEPTSNQQANNLISRDLEYLEEHLCKLAWVVVGPIQCLIFTAIVSQRLDLPTALVISLLNAIVAFDRIYVNFKMRKTSRLANRMADKRMDLIIETLEAIRLVRMYAWTRSLGHKIDQNRCNELHNRRRLYMTDGVDFAKFFIASCATATLALMFGYFVRGLPITQSMVSQLFLLTVIYRGSLSYYLCLGIQSWVQILVSIERCQKYLSASDKLQVFVPGHELETGSSGCISHNGTHNGTKSNSSKLVGDQQHIEIDKSQAIICELKNIAIDWRVSKTKEQPNDKDLSQEFYLDQVNMRALEGELVLVAGQVGSGKSSLLQIVLKEITPTSGSRYLRPGTKVAYASQKAWFFSGSVRDNILLGRSFNLERYYEVIRVCALIPDLYSFPDFDRTRIGERGATLSGGQKARINLARALYQQADLYLLDDPLSAVDGQVASHIFDEALRGFLRGKTKILVTHQVQYLSQVDKILYLGCNELETTGDIGVKDNNQQRVNFFGSYDELKKSNMLRELLDRFACDQTKQNNCSMNDPKDELFQDKGSAQQNKIIVFDRDLVMDRILFNRFDESMRITELPTMNQLMTRNQDEMYEISESRSKNRGHVRTSRVVQALGFYMNNAGGWFAIISFILINIAARSLFLSLNIFLNLWAGSQIWAESKQLDDNSPPSHLGNKFELDDNNNNKDHQYDDLGLFARWTVQLGLWGALGVAFLIWLVVILVTSVRAIQYYTLATNAGINIHRRLINALLDTSLSFFDQTPQGHLINRLAADISYMDCTLVYLFDTLTISGLGMVSMLIGIVISLPKLGLVLLILIACTYCLFRYLCDLMKILKLLDGFRRADLYSHIGATLDGLMTIRSAEQEDSFTQTFNHLLDQHSSVRFLIISVRRFIVGTMDWIMIAFYIFLVSFNLNDTLQGNGSYAFVSLNLVAQLAPMVQTTLLKFMEFYLTVQSMDRIFSYATGLENERLQLFGAYVESNHDLVALTKTSNKQTKKDLHRKQQHVAAVGLKEAHFYQGAIEFSGVSLKFLHTNKLVLDNISFRIEPGTKVGIVGRTGAGKSSLITVLFHLYHFEGFVYIDGQDTKQLELDSLRSSISIIPQDPYLFTGSIRHNLDPFEIHSDEELWRALGVVQLKQLVQANLLGLGMLVEKSGANFSIGQRQLICLARAILNGNKILVMDEATSNIDQENDALIQLAIKNEFKHCTVLTIAHRLSTVIDLDKLMIMQDGRLVEFGTAKELLERGSSGALCAMIDATGEQQAALLRSKINCRSNN